jgi:hypothetical protein
MGESLTDRVHFRRGIITRLWRYLWTGGVPRTKDTEARELVTLKHAADILGRNRDEIDALVRRENIVSAVGKRGKGGQLSIATGDLANLEAAAELAELKIPMPSIRIMIRRMDELSVRVAMVYRRGTTQVIPFPSPETIVRIATHGATVKVIDIASLRRSIESRLGFTVTPPTRGRPKFDIKRVLEQLEASAELGDDDATPDEIAELTGRPLPSHDAH